MSVSQDALPGTHGGTDGQSDTVLRLPNGIIRQVSELFVPNVLSLVWSLPAGGVERVWFGPPHPARPR